jgi:hypothetical protein
MACGDDDDDDDGNGGSAGSAGSSGGAGGMSGRDGGTTGGTGGGTGGMGGRDGGTTGGTGGATGGSGGMTGGDGGDNDSGVDESDGGAAVIAIAIIEGIDDSDITGTASFEVDGADVKLTIELESCPDGAHAVHIHEGATCDNYAGFWDTNRGTGIPDVTCVNDHGEAIYTRLGSSAKPWSVGIGEDDTDVQGHTFMVHATDGTAIGCGEIELED